jgi:hypothetical protein
MGKSGTKFFGHLLWGHLRHITLYLKASNEVTGHNLPSDTSGLTENLF